MAKTKTGPDRDAQAARRARIEAQEAEELEEEILAALRMMDDEPEPDEEQEDA